MRTRSYPGSETEILRTHVLFHRPKLSRNLVHILQISSAIACSGTCRDTCASNVSNSMPDEPTALLHTF